MKRLGPDADRVQVLFVTVDPDRDKKELLANYVPAFDRRFVAHYGDADATARTAKDFKALCQKQPGCTPKTYTGAHSARTFLYDRKGKPRASVGYGQGADVFVHDILVLLKRAGSRRPPRGTSAGESDQGWRKTGAGGFPVSCHAAIA